MARDLAKMYLSLMEGIRGRLDRIDILKASPGDEFLKSEEAAFHGRKIVEGIAFGCLVATEHGLKSIPRSARGHWNAEQIFRRLKKKGIEVFPSPTEIRLPTVAERNAHNVKAVLEGLPAKRLTHEELIEIYQRLHSRLHELNPYVAANDQSLFEQKIKQLWEDIACVRLFIESHVISLRGQAFFCLLFDRRDNETKVVPLSKIAEI